MFKSQYQTNTSCISPTLYVKLELANSHLLMQISQCYFAQEKFIIIKIRHVSTQLLKQVARISKNLINFYFHRAGVNQQPPVHKFRTTSAPVQDEALNRFGDEPKTHLLSLPRDFSAPFSASKFFPLSYSPLSYLLPPPTSFTSFPTHSNSKAPESSLELSSLRSIEL